MFVDFSGCGNDTFLHQNALNSKNGCGARASKTILTQILRHEDDNTVCFVRSAHGRSLVRKCQELEEFAHCTLIEQEEIETVAKNRKYAGAFRCVFVCTL